MYPENCLIDSVACVSQESFVDIANLLYVNISKGDLPRFALDVGNLHRP